MLISIFNVNSLEQTDLYHLGIDNVKTIASIPYICICIIHKDINCVVWQTAVQFYV